MINFKNMFKFPPECESQANSINRYGRGITNPNSFNNWFPFIKDIVKTPLSNYWLLDYNLQRDFISSTLDCKEPVLKDEMQDLINEIDKWILNNIEYPVFLKSGNFSGKHTYNTCCIAKSKDDILENFKNIFYNMAVVSCDDSPFFVVRKFLDISHSEFKAFDDMPMVKEIRFFTKDSKVESWQHYWVKEAFYRECEVDNLTEKLDKINSFTIEEIEYLTKETLKVATKLTGTDWSVDWLQDANCEWYCIDLGEYNKSFKIANRNFLK